MHIGAGSKPRLDKGPADTAGLLGVAGRDVHETGGHGGSPVVVRRVGAIRILAHHSSWGKGGTGSRRGQVHVYSSRNNGRDRKGGTRRKGRSEEHKSEIPSLMRN